MELQSSSTTLTAAERRERRRAKILSNADNRIGRILSGPTGEEKRQAPAMEGGDFKSSPAADILSSPILCDPPKNDANDEALESSRSFFFSSGMSQMRLEIIIAIGLVLGIITATGPIQTVLIPWMIVFATLEVYNESKQTSNGMFMQMMPVLMGLGINQPQVSKFVRLYEIGSTFFADTATFIFSFLIFNYLASICFL